MSNARVATNVVRVPPCTCHPDDNPPHPCRHKYALTECRLAALVAAALPFARHDWMDAELEDDNCKLTKHSGPITVGHWRELRTALAPLVAEQETK